MALMSATVTDYPTSPFAAEFSAAHPRETFQVRREAGTHRIVAEAAAYPGGPFLSIGTITEAAPAPRLGGLFDDGKVVLPLAPLGSLNYFLTVPIETAHAMGIEVED